MLPRNPFFIRQTEKIDTVASFLSIFNPKLIDYIKEDDLQKTIFFRSTPGGGKTSIFRLFSPSVLKELVRNSTNENYSECYRFVNSISAIDSKRVNVLGVYIPCARNYSIIDDIYENGRRTQVFFALLNLRIIMATLKGVLELVDSNVDGLRKIKFKNIPDELKSCIDENSTGYNINEWAISEENRLCLSLDNLDEKPNIPFVHNVLISLKLIQGDNILFNNENIVKKTIVMFDDLHKLTSNQRNVLINCIFQLRPDIGIWMAERCSALTENEVLGDDGRIGREYEEKYIEKNLYENSSNSFIKALTDVADRRVRVNHMETVGNFKACIQEEIGPNRNEEKKIKNAIINLGKEINSPKYKNVLEYIDKKNISLYEKAIYFRIVKIIKDRISYAPQMSFDLGIKYSIKKFEEDLNPNIKNSAELYLCIENNIPLYYGFNKLCELSFFNIEQFLSIAGAIFERRIAFDYINIKNRPSWVSAAEQEEIIINVATDRWNEILKQYSNGREVQILLKNIINIGVASREKALGSYTGGAFTGIGIKNEEVFEMERDPVFKDFLKILSICISANLLSIREVTQGSKGQKMKVFYLNRMLCALNKLPLQYGGFKPIKKNNVLSLLSDSLSINDYEDSLLDLEVNK